jgi:plastocyanin
VKVLPAFGLALALMHGGAFAATHVVVIEGMKFAPAELTVQAGDQVTWENRDVVPHTATAPGKFNSQEIATGKRWTWTAAAPGRIDYVCTYHPGMKATVVVK